MIRRVVNWALWAVVAVVVLIAAAALGGILWLRTPWGAGFVRDQIVSRVSGAMTGSVRLSGVEGDILSGVTLLDFALLGPDSVPLIAAERVEVRYALRPFFDKRIVIGRLRLVHPEIHLMRGTDGRWNFQTMWKPRAPRPPQATPGWASHIEIGELTLVDGTVDVQLAEGRWPILDWNENRFLDVDGTVDLGIFSRDRNLQRFEIERMSFRATHPTLEVRQLAGTGIVTPESLAFREILIETAGSKISADGRLALAPSDSFAIDVSAPRLDLAEAHRFFPEIRLTEGTARFEGKLEGPARNPTVVIDAVRVETGRSVVNAEGALREIVARPVFDLEARVEPLAPEDARLFIEASPIAQPVNGAVTLEGPLEALAIDGDFRAPAGAFSVEGSLGGGGGPLRYDLLGTSRELDVGGLIGRPDVDLTLTGAFAIEGQGTGPQELDAQLVATLERSRIYRWEILSLETHGRLEGRIYAADTLVARTPQSTIQAEGRFALASDGVIEADIVLESEDLNELWPGLGEFSGETRATTRLQGTYQGFDVDADVAAADVELRGVAADSFAGRIALEGVGGRLTMEGGGTLYELRAAGIEADTAAVALDYAEGRMAIEGTFDHPGPAATLATGVADFTGPRTTFTLEQFVYDSPEATWRMAEGSRLVLTGDEVVAEDFRITRNGQVLRADGTLDLDGGSSNLEFAAENVDLKEVARLTGQAPGDWAGRANMRGSLSGSRRAPVLTVDGGVSDGMIGGFRFVNLEGEVAYADRQAEIDVTVTTSEAREIVVAGTVPVNLALVGGVDRLPDEPVDLTIRGENTDLSLVSAFVPGLTDVGGPVDLRVDVSGTTESPRFEGEATVADGTFTVTRTGVTYADISGNISFNNDRIVVEEITGTDSERGSFRIDGQIAMENLQLGEIALTLTGEELEVMELSQQEIQVQATIEMTGTTKDPVITGSVTVDEAVYRLPERSEKNIIDLDEAVVYVDFPGARGEPEAQAPSFWTRTRLDIEIRVTDDVVLTSGNARIEIAGDLSLFKPPGIETPTFSGTLDVRRGYYEEFGQRFTIEEGEVFFYGTPDLNPGLHIVASRTVPSVEGIGDVNIRIIVGGTLKSPTIDLESTPAFDKSEIISIALFGTPNPSAGQQSRLRREVTGLVAGAFAAPLQAALAEELNLDLVEFEQRQESGGQEESIFRVGKFITPDVYVTFEQEVSAGDKTQQAVGLRYVISEIFTVQATAGTEQTGVDLFWEFTY